MRRIKPKMGPEYLVMGAFFSLQLLYVFLKKPCACVSDEFTYKQVALDLFSGKPVSTFHYPFLYPLFLAPSFVFGNGFYYAMLFENVVMKSVFLLVFYRQLKAVANEKDRICALVMLAASPIYFMYSDWIMSENLFTPILIFTILFYIRHRFDEENAGGQNKWRKCLCTMVAGGLCVALYEIKYLALVCFPVLFLFWFETPVRKFLKTRKLTPCILIHMVLYIGIILLVICSVPFIYCMKSGNHFNFDILKASMGFTIGSGPANTGYKIMPELKWVVCYAAYAFLGTALVCYAAYRVKVRGGLPEREKWAVIFLQLLSMSLIYVAARHSSLISYNENGHMLKLLGRYVSYITVIQIIVFFIYLNSSGGSLKYKVDKVKSKCAGVVVCLLVVFSYGILYRRLLWNSAADWLESLRGLENQGYCRLGWLMVMLTVILIMNLLRQIGTKKVMAFFCVFCIINTLCSYTAHEFYQEEKDYVVSTQELISRYASEPLAIYNTSMDKYIGSLQAYSFLYIGEKNSDMWFLQAGISEGNMAVAERTGFVTVKRSEINEECYANKDVELIGADDSDVAYLLFDETQFQEKEPDSSLYTIDRKQDTVIMLKGSLELCNFMIVMDGNQILSYENVDGFYKIAVPNMESKELVLYNFSDLTAMKIQG